MYVLIKPAVGLMNRLKVQHKMLLLALVALTAIAIVSQMLWGRIQADRSFAQLETLAAPLSNPARNVMQHLQDHRGFAQASLIGNFDNRSAMATAQTKIDAAFSAGSEAVAQYGDIDPQLKQKWQALNAQWRTVKTQATAISATESFRLHTELVESLAGFTTSVADATKASLDPELLTYYLMDLFVVKTPRLSEHLDQAKTLAANIAMRKAMTVKEGQHLYSLMNFVKDDMVSMRDSLAKAVGNEPALKAVLNAPAENVEKDVAELDKLINSKILQNKIEIDPQQILTVADRAIDAAYVVFDGASAQFDRQLLMRLSNLNFQLYSAIGALAGSLALAVYLFLGFRHGMLNSIEKIKASVHQLTQSNFSQALHMASKDEFGEIGSNLNSMREQLRTKIETERLEAEENLRIRNALDKASTSIMLANTDGIIIYCNDAVLKLLAAAERDLRLVLPQFSAAHLLGSNVDELYEKLVHSKNFIQQLNVIDSREVRIGQQVFKLTAGPVLNANGTKIGVTVEWLDRSLEAQSEKELNALMDAVVAGDFSQRLLEQNKHGFFLGLSQSMNQLLNIVTDGMTEVGRVLNAIARGDLTEKVHAEYRGLFAQLKEDTNATVDHLSKVVSQIQESTQLVSTAALQISAGNSDLSSRTEQQASSLEETASSMEELNATVKTNADNAMEANKLAHASNEIAAKGGQMVQQVVGTMIAIQESSKKISDIIGVIDSIAFQTNILALNAAVEAARAGEQGRGFAVVATEVRSLAQRSAQAAKEIKTLIAASVGRVDEGAKLVQDAGHTMDDVVTSFQKVAALVTDISSASREQAGGIDQVAKAVGEMDEVTQQNAALVEEAAAAAESLVEQAHTLDSIVAMFKLQHTQQKKSAATKPKATQAASAKKSHKTCSTAAVPKIQADKISEEWEAF